MMMMDGLLLLQFPYTHSPAAADPLSLNLPASKPQRSSKQAAGDDDPIPWNPKASWLLGRRGGNGGGRLTCMYCCWWSITQSAGCEWAPTIQWRLVCCRRRDIMSELDCGYNNPLLRHNRRGDLVVSSFSVQQTWRELWLHSAYLTLLISTVRSFFLYLSLCVSVSRLNSLGTCVFIASCVSKKTWKRILMHDFACPLCKICKVCFCSDLVMHPCVAWGFCASDLLTKLRLHH